MAQIIILAKWVSKNIDYFSDFAENCKTIGIEWDNVEDKDLMNKVPIEALGLCQPRVAILWLGFESLGSMW